MHPTRQPLTRRAALWVGVSALALASTPSLALDWSFGNDGHSPSEQDTTGRLNSIRLTLYDNDIIVVRGVVIITDSQRFGAPLWNQVDVRDENKLSFTQDIPLIGQFFSERLTGNDFSNYNRLGEVYFHDQTLLIDLRSPQDASNQDLPAEDELPSRLVALSEAGAPKAREIGLQMGNGTVFPIEGLRIANKTESYGIPAAAFHSDNGAAGLTYLAQVPTLGGLFRQSVGTAHIKNKALLLMVRPSVLTGWQ